MEETMNEMTTPAGSGSAPVSSSPADAATPACLCLTVVNPADNAHFDLAEVPPETTPAAIIDLLVSQGFLPAPPAGRAYVMSIQGGHDLDPGQSLGAGGVPSGATLQVFSDARGAAVEAVRRERLRGDAAEMAHIRGTIIDWQGSGGTPPSAYIVAYHLPSYLSPWFTRRDRHRVRFDLPPTYPMAPPTVRLLDRAAVFHPNVFPDGRICIGPWSPVEGLAFLVIRVAKMLLYYESVTNPHHPANPAAAAWYMTHRVRFPLLRGIAFPDPLTGVSQRSQRNQKAVQNEV